MNNKCFDANFKCNIFQQILDISDEMMYWKNVKGEYLGCNQPYLKKLCDENRIKNTVSDITGMTDFDLFPKIIAKNYQENDTLVIQTKKELVIREYSYSCDSHCFKFLSKKYPLFHDGVAVGVYGYTYDFSYLIVDGVKIKISYRELQVYATLFLGMSAKESGSFLGISSKTVENHTASIKKKTNRHLRSELIKIITNNDLQCCMEEILK